MPNFQPCFDGKATEMKVLERWKMYLDDTHYLSLINNEELLHYSQLIFPKTPEQEMLLQKLK